MNSNPKFSVIIPVYNGMPYIEKTVESALDQNYPAHEVIVVDDGSTDETPQALQKYKDRIIYIRIPNSGGPSAPRNQGMAVATGEYIALLDADDLWFKTKLSVHRDFALKYPDIGFFASNFAVRYPDLGGRMMLHYNVLSEPHRFIFNEPLKDAFKLLLHQNYIGTPSAVVFKKETAQKAGLFDEECRLVEDLNFFLRMATVSGLVLIEEALFYKRTHDASMSANRVRLLRGHEQVLLNAFKVQKDYIDKNRLWPYCRMAHAGLCYQIGDAHYEAGNPKEAFRSYRRGWSTSPTLDNLLPFLWKMAKKSVRAAFGAKSRPSYFKKRR